MALEIQNKLELMLMVYNDTLDKSMKFPLAEDELSRRAEDMVRYHKELQQAIDNLAECDDLEPQHNLQELFLQKDVLIDKHNQIKKDIIKLSDELDQKIENYITKPKY